MSLPNVYTQAYGRLPAFLKKIQEGQAPPRFTQQHLKDIGFSSTAHRSYIPVLKAIGFLSSDGVPTPRYNEYRDQTKDRVVLGNALKEAYSDIFVLKSNPTERDKALIQGKFKSGHNVNDRPAELMAKTFLALLKLADIKHDSPSALTGLHESPTSMEDIAESSQATSPGHMSSTLHYNIQIHLPATKDVEVYNAIFRSLREQLLD